MAKQVSPGVLALRKVVDDVYADAREAKKQGKLVGWSSSKFPCELAEAFDLNVMYPENQAAGIAAQRDGEIMCQAAEDLGFDNDICGYARISLAYAAGKRASRKFDPETLEFIIDPNSGKPLKDENGKVVIDPETGKPKKDPKTQVPYTVLDDIHEIEALPETTEKEIAYKNFRREAIKPYKQMRIPQPDFVLCCNNICNCMTKWYENIARMCNIPLIMVDIPYNNTVEVSDSAVKYVRAQFDNAIHELEKLTGKKFDEKKFELACKHANRTAQNWLKVCDFLQYKPAPMSGFDLFNHMADVVTARGKEAAADAFELLSKDLQKNIEEGTSTLPFPEQYRVMFEGIPCWPKLPNLFKPLKENGINVTATTWTKWPALTTRLRTPSASSRALPGVRASAATIRSTACSSTTTAPASPGPVTWLKCSAASPLTSACPAPVSTATRLTRATSTKRSTRPACRVWSRLWKPTRKTKEACKNEYRSYR